LVCRISSTSHGDFCFFLSLARYSQDLAKVMKKALLIGKVASVSWELEQSRRVSDCGVVEGIASSFVTANSDDASHASGGGSPLPSSMRKRLESVGSVAHSSVAGTSHGDDANNLSFSMSDRIRLNKLLGEWEEPDTVDRSLVSCLVSCCISLNQLTGGTLSRLYLCPCSKTSRSLRLFSSASHSQH
jgi:hypothetical protein